MGKKKNKSKKHNHQPAAQQPVATPVEASKPVEAEVVAPVTPEVTIETTTPEVTPAPAAPQVKLMDKEPIAAAMEEKVVIPTAGAAVAKRSNKYTLITIALVIIALLVVVFQLEKQGRIGTNVFGPIMSAMEANAPVAVVNGAKLTAEDLASGVEQLEQAAVAQGMNPEDPQVRAEINSQAIEMIVNTTLLEQAAAENGIVIDEATIDARIDELAQSAGGKEALMARLLEFGIDEEQLVSDVTEELTIRALLETVFTETDAVVTQEEITEVYNNAVAASGGQPLPPLAEVTAQIEQQLIQTKEQEAVEAYVQQLRTDADIVVN